MMAWPQQRGERQGDCDSMHVVDTDKDTAAIALEGTVYLVSRDNETRPASVCVEFTDGRITTVFNNVVVDGASSDWRNE